MRMLYWPLGALVGLMATLGLIWIQPVAAANTPTPAPTTPAASATQPPGTPQAGTAQASTSTPDMVAHGQYLVSIIGCADCHTQIDANGNPLPNMQFAGGRPFVLDQAGHTVYSKNLTEDQATGLGNWTDDQIKTAITTGIDNQGKHLFPVMPYLYFNIMADYDLDSIVAYLRTIPPISNAVPADQLPPGTQFPNLTRKSGITAPDPKDTAARGHYLMTSLLTCGDCHTPVDPATGAPDPTKYLAGGQPFEGPWGVVYGGNLTPDQKTGIGSWTDDQIRTLIRTGVRPDGRATIVMPWQVYTHLTDDDLNAVIHYLRTEVKPVANVVPAAALTPGPQAATQAATAAPTQAVATQAATATPQVAQVTQAATEAPVVPQAATQAASTGGTSTTLIIVAVIAVLVVAAGLIFFTRRGGPGGG